jgi:hypothetical protein
MCFQLNNCLQMFTLRLFITELVKVIKIDYVAK